MHTKQSALERKKQEAREGLLTSSAVRIAENHTIPYSGWKEKGLGIDGRFYGASKRAVQGPVGSTGFAAVVLERNQATNGLLRRSPTRVVFFSDRQMALDTARRWFRQAQNIPVDEDIIKFHATLWARPPKTKAVSTKATLMENPAGISAGEVSSGIASQIPHPGIPKLPIETAQASASARSQSRWRVLFDSLLARLALFRSWMKSLHTLQAYSKHQTVNTRRAADEVQQQH